jgi:A/G-specific adenine glycosylase
MNNTRVVSAVRRALLAWYDGRQRDLPWRKSRDPYRIWLSEIMLQQTTVRTVMPRWERFLQRWPTLPDLAAAPLEDVLHEWTGLGYYARARNLHRAAQVVAKSYGGALPADYEQLLSLPGMGVYTAAAVASIAFGEPVPVVDANVERVLSRLYAIEEELRSAAAKKRLRERAAALLDPARAGDFNQAMMELGALVCIPKRPQCGVCPVGKWCAGRATGTPEAFPRLRAKAPMEDVREVAVLLRRAGRVLVLLRPAKASFGGMWEVPRVRVEAEERAEEAAVRAARELAGFDVTVEAPALRLRHVVMRSRIALLVYPATIKGGSLDHPEHEEARWVTSGEWMAMPKSTTQADIAEFLRTGKAPKRAKKEAAEDGEGEAEARDLFGE